MPLNGNARVIVGEITQSKLKGKALENALASGLMKSELAKTGNVGKQVKGKK